MSSRACIPARLSPEGHSWWASAHSGSCLGPSLLISQMKGVVGFPTLSLGPALRDLGVPNVFLTTLVTGAVPLVAPKMINQNYSHKRQNED